MNHWGAAAVLVLLAGSVHAEQVKKFGDYDIHYNAFNSSSLTADVARQYGITRGANQGLVNIVVRKRNDSGDAPAAAKVSGSARNLLSQRSELKFKEVRSGEAIYYIAVFRFDNQDMLTFDIDVQPTDSGDKFPFHFQQQMYVQ